MPHYQVTINDADQRHEVYICDGEWAALNCVITYVDWDKYAYFTISLINVAVNTTVDEPEVKVLKRRFQVRYGWEQVMGGFGSSKPKQYGDQKHIVFEHNRNVYFHDTDEMREYLLNYLDKGYRLVVLDEVSGE